MTQFRKFLYYCHLFYYWIPPIIAFLGQLGGISFTMQSTKISRTFAKGVKKQGRISH